MQRPQGPAGNPVAVGNVLQQIQRVLQQQPRVGQLVSIGGPTVLAGHAAGGATVSSPSIQSSQPPTTNPSYAYKVKIINPNKKSDVSVRHLHECSTKFESVMALRIKLIESFKESVPNTVDFNVGYYEGSQQAKIWLVVPEDLEKMYERYAQGGAITLWCDGRSDDGNDNARKRKRDNETSKKHSIEENERDVDEVYKKLLDTHGSKWDSPRLRLWARCISTEHHSSYEDPPDLPAFKEPETKKRKESLTDALAGAAVAFASAMSGGSQNQVCRSAHLQESGPSVAAVSPGKTVELRMKNYEQLRVVQQLYDDGIIDDKEFAEQKQNILTFLRKIN